MLITIKKYIFFMIFFLILCPGVCDLINFPLSLSYLIYVMSFFLIVLFATSFKSNIKIIKNNLYIIYFFYLFLFGGVIGVFFNGLVFLHFIFSLVKFLFPFLFLLCCVFILTTTDLDNILSSICKLQLLNFVVSLFQFFILNKYQDVLGGIFGTSKGVNSYSNLFFLIICCYAITKYLSNCLSIWYLLWIIGSSCLLSAIAEITIFYFELFVIAVLVLVTIKSEKKIKFVKYLSVPFCICIILYFFLYPSRINYLNSFDAIFTYLSAYSYDEAGDYIGGAYSVSRINPFSQINALFFDYDFIKYLFGFGLGNCEMSESLALLQSDFYINNRNFVYYWFSSAFIYLETGMWGIFCYVFFIFNQILKWKKFFSENDDMNYLSSFGIIMSLMSVLLFFYNNTLVTVPCYLLFFSISSLPICLKECR